MKVRIIKIVTVALGVMFGCVTTAQAKLVSLADWTAAKFDSREAMYEACVSASGTVSGNTPNVLFDGTIYSLTEGSAYEWRGTVASDGSCAVTFSIPASVSDEDIPSLDRYLLHRSPHWYSQSGSPTKWELQGRNSEDEDWTTIDRVDVAVFDRRGQGQNSPACECTYERVLTARVTYRNYRIVFLETLFENSATWLSMQEIEFVVDDGTSGTVRYVSPSGTGDGTSWDNAADLQAALTAAEPEDELWLKTGDYALTADLSAPTACAILGGFAGTETDKSQREATARSTILATAATNAIVMTDVSFRDYVLENLVFTNALHRAIKLGAYGDSSASEVATKKSGAGLRAKNCIFTCNGVTLQDSFTDGIRGRGAWIFTPKGTPVVFEDCVFDRNRNLYTASKRHHISMNGMALNVNFCELTLTRCAFTNNGVPETVTTGGADGRDGTRGAAIYAASATIRATDCLFRGNRALTNSSLDGSVIVIEGSPSGTNSFVGCCFVGNSYAVCGDSTSSTVEFAPTTVGTVTAFPMLFDRCTVAYNLGESCGGIRVDKANLIVRNSIFYGNFMQSSYAVAADIEVLSGATADIDYSLFAERSHIGGTGTITIGSDIVYGDPLFKTSLETVAAQVNSSPVAYPLYASRGYFSPTYDLSTVDVHVEARVSPAIDAGDPAADYANEPSPNGGRLNLGYYGNTSEAAISSTAKPVITSSSVTFGASYTKPTISLALQESDDTYSATVYFCCGYKKSESSDETGWQFVETLASGATPGTSIEVLLKRYLEAGKTLWWRIVVRGGAGIAVVDSASEGVTVEGEMPSLWGKGLGEDYVHVRAGADGLGDGSDWLNAAATVVDAVALVDETHTNLVVAGTVPVGTASMGTLSVPVTIYGGFDGDEMSFDARSSELSTIDGEDVAKNCLIIANKAGCTRVDGIMFTRSTGVAVEKTLAGDITFANSRFFACGSPSETTLTGRTLTADGASTATLTITNCVFDRNWGRDGSYTDSFTGTAGYLTSFKAIDITDTLYATNGFNHSNNGKVNGREGLNGSTLYVQNSPLTLTNCRFIGNRYVVHNGNQQYCCAVEIIGTSPTTMKNCLFTGNGGYATEDDAAFSSKRSGAVIFDLASATTAASIENCTFAYNASSKGHAVGVQMDKGALTIKDSIFYRNQFNTNLTGTCGADLYVGKSATASVSYSLFTGTETPWVYAETDGALTWGEGVLTSDPLFVTTTDEFLSHLAEDTDSKGKVRLRFTDDSPFFSHHLRGRAGYVDETTGLLVKGLGKVESPAIDAGDPTADCANEPVTGVTPRLNLGYYGNTPWATGAYKPSGFMLIVR